MHADTLRMLYYAFVYPHILYGVELYANTHTSYLSKLNTLNDKILRILQNVNRKPSTMCLYQKFNVLPIHKLHQFQLLCIVHKYVYHRTHLPVIFRHYFTAKSFIHHHNSRSKNNLHVSCVRSEYGRRMLAFRASQLWNRLPQCLKNIVSITVFKKELRRLLFHNDM